MRTYVLPEGATAQVQDGYAQILAVHATLLPTNQVLYFGGDQHDPGQFSNELIYTARLFDIATGTVLPCDVPEEVTDLFCCGHALVSGGLVIAGGTLQWSPYFMGTKTAWFYDEMSGTFSQLSEMSDGRWYPTLLALGDGSVLAASGATANGADDNRNLEVLAPDNLSERDLTHFTWRVDAVNPDAFWNFYPRMHLLPDGRVLFVTPFQVSPYQCTTWDPDAASPSTPQPLCDFYTQSMSELQLGAETGLDFWDYTSVLLPLWPEAGYVPRILVANMSQPQVLDLSLAAPSWQDTGPRNVPAAGATPENPIRANGMAVILPSGEVLSCGGTGSFTDETQPVLALELYNPDTDSWATLPVTTSVSRGYHSVTLVLPDGRVFIAGSNKRCDFSFHNDGPPDQPQAAAPGVDNRELRIEFVEPWYYGRPDRPRFTLGSTEVEVGEPDVESTFEIRLERPIPVARVALLRASSSTHAFNPDQRLVGLKFSQHERVLTVRVSGGRNLLPQGPYMVIVSVKGIDEQTGQPVDVPSVGHWISVSGRRREWSREPDWDETLSRIPTHPIDAHRLHQMLHHPHPRLAENTE